MVEYFRTTFGQGSWLVARDGAVWRVYNDDGQQTNASGGNETLGQYQKRQRLGRLRRNELTPGEYYPRMWRGGLWPHPENTSYGKEWRESVRISRMLSARLQDVFRFVEPVKANAKVYSHELRMLFVLACQEVESACKEVLFAHGTPRSQKLTMSQYRKLARPMRLSEWEVNLSTNPSYPTVTPFIRWGASPPKALPWYQAHNEVKHGREQHLEKATLANTIEAVAAVFVLRLAQFGLPALVERSVVIPADEFTVAKEPQWRDTEKYLAPDTPGIGGVRLHAPAIGTRHPKL